MVLTGRGVAGGRTLGEVAAIDLAPTFTTLLGLDPPAQADGPAAGASPRLRRRGREHLRGVVARMTLRGRRSAVVAALVVLAAGTAAVVALRLAREVRQALDEPAIEARPLAPVPVAPPDRPLETWPGGDVQAVAFHGGRLVTGGGAGVRDSEGRDLGPGLPSRRVAALALWTGDLVAALEAGGLFRLRDGQWEELRSGWGVLHARALHEAPGGILLIGAREGVFRAAPSARTLERLTSRSTRALATGPGLLLAGGEDGLVRIGTGPPALIETPDPWIESVVVDGDGVLALTAAGLARGPREGPLALVRGTEVLAQGIAFDGRFWGAADPATDTVRVVEVRGTAGGAGSGASVRDEALPATVRRVISAAGVVFADTDGGLFGRAEDGWRLVQPRAGALPPGPAHVTALARHRGRLVAGFFDGGLAVADEGADGVEWRSIPGSEAWGVNALLDAGGELHVASLRGAARLAGERLRGLDGAGAAFSLASTPDGVAIGYAQGVLLPGSTLLSAFHGLPGNQALALEYDGVLFVGTPSGLGALDGRRVLWRVTAGEGKLPHPWVTALVSAGDGLFVGTWGGGLALRRADRQNPTAREGEDAATWQPFVETEGLEISPGALTVGAGLVWAGTDQDGLWRLRPDRRRFEPLDLPLPSARVTALLAEGNTLWIGTDQGVTRLRAGRRRVRPRRGVVLGGLVGPPGPSGPARRGGPGGTPGPHQHRPTRPLGPLPARDARRRGHRPGLRARQRPAGVREPHRRHPGRRPGAFVCRPPLSSATSRSGTTSCESPGSSSRSNGPGPSTGS